MVTFLTAFRRIGETNPAAADLLRLCAFLEPDNIPEEIFLQGVEALGGRLADEIRQPGLKRVIRDIRAFSLIQQDNDAHLLSIHRVTRDVLLSIMIEQEKQEWTERAVAALVRVFPGREVEHWPYCERVIPHISAVA
jgi:hypothetical protein